MHVCTSCEREFTYSGFTRHGLRTSNLSCQQAYQSAILNQCNLSDDSDIGDAPADSTNLSYDDNHPFNSDPVLFEPQSEHEDELSTFAYSVGDESDSEDSDADEEVNQSADADLLPLDVTAHPIHRHNTDEPVDEPVDNMDGPQADDQQPQLHDVFKQRFTRGRAGAPVDKSGMSADQHYQSELTPNSSDNIYAPFASKLDWEFAKWAKSCGISSTALTDLLNIEGVRLSYALEGRSNDGMLISSFLIRSTNASIFHIGIRMSSTSSSTMTYPAHCALSVKM